MSLVYVLYHEKSAMGTHENPQRISSKWIFWCVTATCWFLSSQPFFILFFYNSVRHWGNLVTVFTESTFGWQRLDILHSTQKQKLHSHEALSVHSKRINGIPTSCHFYGALEAVVSTDWSWVTECLTEHIVIWMGSWWEASSAMYFNTFVKLVYLQTSSSQTIISWKCTLRSCDIPGANTAWLTSKAE